MEPQWTILLGQFQWKKRWWLQDIQYHYPGNLKYSINFPSVDFLTDWLTLDCDLEDRSVSFLESLANSSSTGPVWEPTFEDASSSGDMSDDESGTMSSSRMTLISTEVEESSSCSAIWISRDSEFMVRGEKCEMKVCWQEAGCRRCNIPRADVCSVAVLTASRMWESHFSPSKTDVKERLGLMTGLIEPRLMIDPSPVRFIWTMNWFTAGSIETFLQSPYVSPRLWSTWIVSDTQNLCDDDEYEWRQHRTGVIRLSAKPSCELGALTLPWTTARKSTWC